MNTGRALLGIALVAVGAVLLLGQLDVLDADRTIARFWPVLVLAAAAVELASKPPRVVSATTFALIGLVLLGFTTGLLTGAMLAVLVPVGLMAIGGYLLLRRPSGGGRDVTDGAFDATVLFGGRNLVSTARPFPGGSATAIFGGVEIDLTQAVIEGEATVDAVALFGGVDITVPSHWRVLMDGPAIFGAYESKLPANPDPSAPTLRIRATAIFGGIDVKGQVVSRDAPTCTEPRLPGRRRSVPGTVVG